MPLGMECSTACSSLSTEPAHQVTGAAHYIPPVTSCYPSLHLGACPNGINYMLSQSTRNFKAHHAWSQPLCVMRETSLCPMAGVSEFGAKYFNCHVLLQIFVLVVLLMILYINKSPQIYIDIDIFDQGYGSLETIISPK